MESIKEYLPYLGSDMSEVIVYLVHSITVAVFLGILILLGYRICTNKWNWKKTVLFFVFTTYMIEVFQIVYFSRESGSRTDVAFGLGDTWGTTVQAHAYVIENILLFIPFGILFPMLGKYPRYWCLAAALCFSVGIEGMQYVSKRGYCQLDDVVTNVAGACVGYIVFWLFYKPLINRSK